MNLGDNIYTSAPYLSDCLPLIPNHFESYFHIYQWPSNEIVVFIDWRIYMIEIPSLKLVDDFPKNWSYIVIPILANINGAVNTHNILLFCTTFITLKCMNARIEVKVVEWYTKCFLRYHQMLIPCSNIKKGCYTSLKTIHDLNLMHILISYQGGTFDISIFVMKY